MELINILSKFSGVIGQIIKSIQLALAGLFIRRSTKIEVKKDALEQETKVKDKMLEIASRPPVKPSGVRDELFRDGF